MKRGYKMSKKLLSLLFTLTFMTLSINIGYCINDAMSVENTVETTAKANKELEEAERILDEFQNLELSDDGKKLYERIYRVFEFIEKLSASCDRLINILKQLKINEGFEGLQPLKEL